MGDELASVPSDSTKWVNLHTTMGRLYGSDKHG